MNDSRVYTRKELNRMLYNVARKIVGSAFDEIEEASRQVRARLCKKATSYTRGKSKATDKYKELTLEEMASAIRHGEEELQETSEDATPKQRRYLSRLAIQTALFEADLDGYVYETEEGLLTGEDLKEYMRYANTRYQLPPDFLCELYVRWINPTLNKWLVDANLQAKPKDMSKFYMNKLTKRQASQLITQIEKVHDNRLRKSPHRAVALTN